MAITRHFLDPVQPALPQVVEWLAARYRRGDALDLDRVLLVVPAASAGRRLEELLVAHAAATGLTLLPSKPVTVGDLPERLYPPQRPLASQLTQEFAWSVALRSADEATLRRLFAQPPAADDEAGWRDLGLLLMRQHVELAADGHDFADVARATRELGQVGESQRWQQLRAIQQAYLERLDDLQLWDRQTARLVAIEKHEARSEHDIVLIGTVDLNRALRQLLDQVAGDSASGQVTALIHAPQNWAKRFDVHGCLVPEAWEAAELGVPDEAIIVADGPEEQVGAIAAALRDLGGEYPAEAITVALPDARLQPLVEQVLTECGAPVRPAVGRLLRATPAARLLAAVASYLEQPLYPNFAALVRHPHLESWLLANGCTGDWLAALDELQAKRLPYEIKPWLEQLSPDSPLAAVSEKLAELFAPLGGGRRPLGQWTEPILALLAAVYGARKYDRDAEGELIRAVEKIAGTFQQLEELPAELAPAVTAGEAIREGLAQLGEEVLPPPETPNAVALVGWLELPLDDAPVAVVASFNEGTIPRSVNSDLFLPNTLRRKLALADNARRYARDAYALSTLLASRRRLTLVVGRRDAEFNPLAPSRLLFSHDPASAARQALRLFVAPPTAARPPLFTTAGPPPDRHGLVVPPPRPLPAPLESLSVTQFRNYLACPYRFYLASVLKLASVADDAEELDGGVFGSLAHDVLAILAGPNLRTNSDEEEIRSALLAELDRRVRNAYGRRPLPAVGVQIEQLRVRLIAFAARQAERAAEGWRVERAEVSSRDLEKPTILTVDGQPFRLTGRIDRVDYHTAENRWALLDYKTSDSGKGPKQTHIKKNEWIDLQLPLYRHFAPALDIDGPVELGYVVLPKDTASVKFMMADWTELELAEADERAHEVVRGLRAGVFWEPTVPPPDFSEDWAYICQDGVFERGPLASLGEATP